MRRCRGCDTTIPSDKRRTAAYCSKACGKAHYQHRHAEWSREANRRSYAKHRTTRLAARATKAARRQAYNRAYRAKHLERLREQDRQRDPRKRREHMRAYNQRPEIKARNAEWRRRNRARLSILYQGWIAANRERAREHWLRSTHRRRQIIKTAGSAVDRIDTFERDGWRCQLCGCKTPKTLLSKIAPTAPTLDHIIPLSVGGLHTADNVQCACLRCNCSKGARVLGQLRLGLKAE